MKQKAKDSGAKSERRPAKKKKTPPHKRRKVLRMLTCPEEILPGKETSSLMQGNGRFLHDFFFQLEAHRGLWPFVFQRKRADDIPVTPAEQSRQILELYEFDGCAATHRNGEIVRSPPKRFRMEVMENDDRYIIEIPVLPVSAPSSAS